MSRHIVHKQRVELRISGREDAFAIQNLASNILQNGLRNKMEEIFDQIVPEHEIVRIEKLELDLKTISSGNFEKEFEDRFMEELESALSHKLASGMQTVPMKKLGRSESILRSLLHFLEFGYLPWYESITQMQLWEQDVLAIVKTHEWEFFRKRLKEMVGGNPSVIQRLILQYSDHFLQQIIEKMGLLPETQISGLYEDLNFLLEPSISQEKSTFNLKSEWRRIIWETVLTILLQNDTNSGVQADWVNKIFHAVGAFNVRTLILKKEEIAQGIRSSAIKNAVRQFISLLDTKNRELQSDAGDLFERDEMKDTGITQEFFNETLRANEDEKFAKDKKVRERKRENEDALYVQNSGLVLLHPFLEMYFKELGLLEATQFLSDDHRRRAILLLHYLATGEMGTPEFNLLLQKIVCGLPAEETVPASIELTEKELIESKNLLQSVMNYWPPLKNTSIEGLQQTFFQREGKLMTTETGWLLRVEQKTVDILLARLPWGFSTIRLPWMNDTLHVEWA